MAYSRRIWPSAGDTGRKPGQMSVSIVCWVDLTMDQDAYLRRPCVLLLFGRWHRRRVRNAIERL